MRKLYPTEYFRAKPNGDKARYSAYVLAKDYTEALSLVTQRGMGEVLTTQPQTLGEHTIPILTRLDRHFRKILLEHDCDTTGHSYRVDQLLHAVMHTLNVVLRRDEVKWSKKVKSYFDDQGLLHGLLHLKEFDPLDVEVVGSLELQLARLTEAAPEMFLTEVERHALYQNKDMEVKE